MTYAPNRALVRLAGLAAALSLVVAVAGFRHVIPEAFAFLGLALFVACLVLIALLAWRTRRTILAQRAETERGQMIVMLAARLRDEATGTLEAMSRRGGPSGEAATLILQGRAERQQRKPGPAA